MDPVEGLRLGFGLALTPTNLLFALVGCLVGTAIGVLPGIGPVSGVAILLPVIFASRVDPTSGMIMLAAVYYGSQYGGSTTSILINTPGESSSVMTCLDGYAMANPSEAYEQMRAGKVRALGITTDKRIGDLPDVPTLKEQGVDYVVAQFRGVAGPKGIPADVVAYLEEAFRRVAKSETWKNDYLAKYQQVDGYMGSAEFTSFMDVFFKEQEQAFKDLPSLKQ